MYVHATLVCSFWHNLSPAHRGKHWPKFKPGSQEDSLIRDGPMPHSFMLWKTGVKTWKRSWQRESWESRFWLPKTLLRGAQSRMRGYQHRLQQEKLTVQEVCWVSILGNVQNTAEQVSEWPNATAELALFQRGGWIGQLSLLLSSINYVMILFHDAEVHQVIESLYYLFKTNTLLKC